MSPIRAAAKETLAQLSALLLEVDDIAYATKLPAAFNASIGGHVRHSLDHFRSILEGRATGEIDYDARLRDPRIENHRVVALAATRELLRAFESLDDAALERAIPVRAKVSYAAEFSPTAQSTIGREVMFAVVHAIHHYALIGVMCGMLEVTIPAGFGVAPSTIKHERDKLAA